ncbi:MAG: hypothetical protein R3Y09_09715 [Clostridia bacterium]
MTINKTERIGKVTYNITRIFKGERSLREILVENIVERAISNKNIVAIDE